jgi:hypothetical protein
MAKKKLADYQAKRDFKKTRTERQGENPSGGISSLCHPETRGNAPAL